MYILKFIYNDGYDHFEHSMYFSTLEKIDDFMDKWDKGIAEVSKGLENDLVQCHFADVYEPVLDTTEYPKHIYSFKLREDPDMYSDEE